MPAVLRIAVVLLAQWRMIVACTILAVLASVVYLTTRTPAYEINAELYIQIGQEMAPPPTVFASDRQQASPQLKRPEDVHSEVEFLRSPLLLTK